MLRIFYCLKKQNKKTRIESFTKSKSTPAIFLGLLNSDKKIKDSIIKPRNFLNLVNATNPNQETFEIGNIIIFKKDQNIVSLKGIWLNYCSNTIEIEILEDEEVDRIIINQSCVCRPHLSIDEKSWQVG